VISISKIYSKIQELSFTALFCTALAIITVIIFVSLQLMVQEESEAYNGIINISSSTIAENRIVKLNGNWRFYWKKLYSPTDIIPAEEAKFVYLPGWWNAHGLNDATITKSGYATYQLKLVLPQNAIGKKLLFKIPGTSTAYNLYLDDLLIMSSGNVTKSSDSFSYTFMRETAEFVPLKRIYSLTLQCASYNNRNGGLAYPILLGSKKGVISNTLKKMSFEYFVTAVLLTLSLYHLMLFIMLKSDRSSYLLFALFCMVLATRTSVQGERIFMLTLPTFSPELMLRIWHATYYLATMVFTNFLHHVFFNKKHRILIYCINIITTIFIILVLTASQNFYTSILNYYHIFFICLSLFLFYITISAIVEKKTGSEIMLTGYSIVIFFTANDILYTMRYINTGYYATYGFFIFILSQAYMLSIRLSSTVRKKEFLSSELFKKNEVLNSIDSMKDEFLANTSHELKSPVTGIIKIAEDITNNRQDLCESSVENIQLIIASGKRLSGLIDDLLDFSKLKQGDLRLLYTEVNVNEIISNVLNNLQQLYRNKKVSVITHDYAKIQTIIADRKRLYQIVFNLVDNAYKFTHSGVITITTESLEENNIEYIKISISDTGIGIPADKYEAIFVPFEQLHNSLSRKYSGTGIGLTITKRLIECHNGYIDVESVINNGSSFTVYLPVNNNEVITDTPIQAGIHDFSDSDYSNLYSEEEQNLYEPISIQSNYDFAGSCISIIDDEPINVRVLENQLQNMNFNVSSFHSGEELLDSIKENQLPDLIIMDLMLPGLSGTEVTKILRNEYNLFDLPIIMLTTKEGVHDIVNGFAAGVNDYLKKPFSTYELQARIETHLSLKKSVIERERLISIENDIEIARDIQKRILPATSPQNEVFSICSEYRPSRKIGGDFYYFHQKDNNDIGIMISDVNGHGVHSALVASMLKAIFTALEHTIHQPEHFLKDLERIVIKNSIDIFLTAGVLYLNASNRSLLYSRAGHEPLMIYRKKRNDFEFYTPPGRIIGFHKPLNNELIYINLEPGDRIFLYTDGIYEAFNDKREMFGMERIKSLILKNIKKDKSDLIDLIIKAVTKWGESQNDDITLIIIDIK
jgi:two-component system sensor histidine kinase ChiS